ncbi:MAG: FAD-binding oxidoreductase [Caldilineaceae bacterium]
MNTVLANPAGTAAVLHNAAATSADFAALAAAFTGQLLQAGDEGYELARHVWNGAVDIRPTAIARCANAADVAAALAFALSHELPFSVRGGGHNTPGYALCSGLVIDLSQLKQLDVDTQRKVARAGAGLTFGEIARGLEAHGLAIPTGTCSGTGIAGATLGGGIGWLMGHFGLAVDNVLAVELVTAGSDLLRADAAHHPDLFWALRGGGGNFGIVIAIEYRVHALPNVYAGMLAYPASRAAEVLRLYRAIAAAAPDELTVMCILTTFPNVGPAALLSFCYSGAPAGAERTVAPLYVLGEPSFGFAQTMPYSALLAINDPVAPDGRRYFDTTFSLSDLSDGAIAAIVANAAAATSPFSGIIFQHVHGAAVRVAPSATAYPFRHPHFAVVNSAAWEAGDGAEHIAWAKSAAASMQPFAARGAYVNFLGDEGAQAVRDAYGPNYTRLAAVKQEYDPANRFRRNQNIVPAGRVKGL